MTKEICNLKDLSNYLKISISEIRKLVREKKIPHFRIGNRIMFDLKSINTWVEKLQEKESKTSLFYQEKQGKYGIIISRQRLFYQMIGGTKNDKTTIKK